MKKRIKLTEKQYQYLFNNILENNLIKSQIDVEYQFPFYFIIAVPDIIVDLWILCEDKLVMVGFDDDDELTEEGRILDEFLDKFFL